jgi:N6-L-threonylcarbamoyladenine synthase
MLRKPLTVLALETSCDETAAAVVRGNPPGPGEILSNITYSQIAEHQPYGGVVPEIAARAHVELLDGLIERALAEAGMELGDMDAVAATAGPGLIGGVMVGLIAAKALALAAGKPLIAVNHLEAHALSARLCSNVAFPFLLLLISGGHCQLVAAEALGRYTLYGTTIDDAVGECFDKAAKLLGLPYPGGPQIERLARAGDPKGFSLPRPMLGREGADFSFSGLKTAVRQLVAKHQPLQDKPRAGIAASLQDAIADVLDDRVRSAMRRFRKAFAGHGQPFDFVAAGGVAANGIIRERLAALAEAEDFSLTLPPLSLCTDNAAMVCWAGLERLAAGLTDGLDAPARDRWPLESLHQPRQM